MWRNGFDVIVSRIIGKLISLSVTQTNHPFTITYRSGVSRKFVAERYRRNTNKEHGENHYTVAYKSVACGIPDQSLDLYNSTGLYYRHSRSTLHIWITLRN